jgi:hypothetical protein
MLKLGYPADVKGEFMGAKRKRKKKKRRKIVRLVNVISLNYK